MNDGSVVPVVFCTNENYVPYLGVALHSLISHVSKSRKYEVYILHTSLGKDSVDTLEALSKNNIQIRAVDISDLAGNWEINSDNWLTVETLYRLSIPKILPRFKRIIYLDCDIIVFHDVAELYDIPLDGNILGAVSGELSDTVEEHMINNMHVSHDEFFNSGVLSINCELFEKENIREKCLQILSQGKSFPFQDQDSLNMVCRGRVKFIDWRWNAEWGWTVLPNTKIIRFNRFDMTKPTESPYILHYSTHIKPWENPHHSLSKYFWQYAYQTEFFEEIVRRNASKFHWTYNPESNIFSLCRFPYALIPSGCRIALYGAGAAGKSVIQQLSIIPYCSVVIWADKNYHNVKKDGYDVLSPSELLSVDYDYLVIAIESEDVANEAKIQLMQLGIPKNKIIWK